VIELTQWLESASEARLNALRFGNGEGNALAKFVRHLLGIGRAKVDWNSVKQSAAKQANGYLIDRVRTWRGQTTGLSLQSQWEEWREAVWMERQIREWEKQNQAGYCVTRELLDKNADKVAVQVALDKKVDKLTLDGNVTALLTWLTPMVPAGDCDEFCRRAQAFTSMG